VLWLLALLAGVGAPAVIFIMPAVLGLALLGGSRGGLAHASISQ